MLCFEYGWVFFQGKEHYKMNFLKKNVQMFRIPM